jgi:hypothetical protein
MMVQEWDLSLPMLVYVCDHISGEQRVLMQRLFWCTYEIGTMPPLHMEPQTKEKYVPVCYW